jgi:hypothetical protein
MWDGGVGSVRRVREENGRQGPENPLEPVRGKTLSEIN